MARVRLTRKALADLAAIESYLAERDPTAASRVISAIEHSLSLLADHPQLGRREPRGLGHLHTVPRYRYVISYRVSGDTVEVRFIFHPKQARSS